MIGISGYDSFVYLLRKLYITHYSATILSRLLRMSYEGITVAPHYFSQDIRFIYAYSAVKLVLLR